MELLEREPQLTALQGYADEARAGSGRLVLVSGEAGIGKSSIIEAFERRLDEARWAWGACDSLATPRPLGPLFDLAPALDEDLDRLCRSGAPRDILFDAVLERLGALGVDGPLTVLVVEDVHWADDATLDLLRFLSRRLRNRRALVLVTYRDDALAPTGQLRTVIGELAAQRSTRRIGLPPLSRRALARLAEGTGVEPGALHVLTGGNAFFVTEVLRSPHDELPASVRDVVLAKAARLGDAARSALDTAALIGSRVRPGLLVRVTGAASRDIDEMLVCGVIRVDGDGFVFRHELARLAIERAIAPHRRALAHRAILAALLEAGENDAHLAFHAEAAGDADAAVRHARLAARYAAGLGSHREALAQYERAARFADRLDERERGGLLDALATEAALVDQGDRAIEARTAAIAVWRGLGDILCEGNSVTELVSVLQSTAHGAEATEAAELAVAVLEPLGDTDELARALCNLAGDRMMSGRFAEAIAVAERAILLAERRSLPDVLCDALNTKGSSLDSVGSDGRHDLEHAVRIALDHELGSQAGRAYSNLQALLLGALRFREAERVFTEGIDYCDHRDLAFWGWCLRRERFHALERAGRWAEATALCDEVLGSQLSVWNRIQALETAAVLRARRGDPGAWDVLDETRAGVVGIGEPQYLMHNAVVRAEVHWLGGNLDAARAELADVADLADRVPFGEGGPLVAWTKRLRGVVLSMAAPLASPYRAELGGRIEDAVREWDAHGCPYEAALALAFSDDETHLREAIARLDRLGATAAVRAVRRRMRGLGIRSIPAGSRSATRANPAGLTRREQEVLELLCDSLSNEQIAERLVLSVRTVDHHVSAILGKLGVASRQLAAETAKRSGLVPARSEN
jgi:DNA-binding CsgD family transcriptional regulator/tetratricopeptide (TPR) repeat protein